MTHPHQPSGIAFRIADPVADAGTLFALFRDARASEFASLEWDDKRLTDLLRAQFQAQSSDYRQRFPGSERRLVEIGGETVALVWVWRSDEQVRLLDIIVAAPTRNAGIGTELMRLLQSEAATASLPLRHMVAVTNAGAIRFYERLGFAVAADAGSHVLMEWLPPTTPATDPPRLEGD